MTQRLVFGFHGLPGSGKDMLADYLVAHHGFTKMAFADRLKEEACRMFSVPASVFDDRLLKTVPNARLSYDRCQFYPFIRYLLDCALSDGTTKWEGSIPRTPRQIMQKYGDFCRSRSPNYFVDTILSKIETTPGNVVVTDVRFDNEATAIYMPNGGLVFEIVRPENPFVEVPDNHASNARLLNCLISDTIINEGAPDVMYEAIERILKYFAESS